MYCKLIFVNFRLKMALFQTLSKLEPHTVQGNHTIIIFLSKALGAWILMKCI